MIATMINMKWLNPRCHSMTGVAASWEPSCQFIGMPSAAAAGNAAGIAASPVVATAGSRFSMQLAPNVMGQITIRNLPYL